MTNTDDIMREAVLAMQGWREFDCDDEQIPMDGREQMFYRALLALKANGLAITRIDGDSVVVPREATTEMTKTVYELFGSPAISQNIAAEIWTRMVNAALTVAERDKGE